MVGFDYARPKILPFFGRFHFQFSLKEYLNDEGYRTSNMAVVRTESQRALKRPLTDYCQRGCNDYQADAAAPQFRSVIRVQVQTLAPATSSHSTLVPHFDRPMTSNVMGFLFYGRRITG
jgi:hypothetical protein